MQELCRQPHHARLTTARMSYAQARAAMLSASKSKGFYSLRLFTVIYYYCVSHRNYAVKAFASLSLALLKLIFLVRIRLAPNRTNRKKVFVYARPYGVTRYVIS